jgi:hypothetical protein
MNTSVTAAALTPSSPNPNKQQKQTAKEVIAAKFDMVTNLISEKKIPALDELQRRLSCTICSPPRPEPSVFRWPRLRIDMTTTIRERWTCFLPPRCRWRSEQRASGRKGSLFIPPIGKSS